MASSYSLQVGQSFLRWAILVSLHYLGPDYCILDHRSHSDEVAHYNLALEAVVLDVDLDSLAAVGLEMDLGEDNLGQAHSSGYLMRGGHSHLSVLYPRMDLGCLCFQLFWVDFVVVELLLP